MSVTGRPLRRSVMARWRAVNSSCMGTSVVRPLAVAHGGYSSRTEEGKKVYGAVRACTTDRERSDQLSGRFNENGAISCRQKMSDQLSGRNYGIDVTVNEVTQRHRRRILSGFK